MIQQPVHTYSIVARDPATGEMGVAVQSHYFATGVGVTWAEAGVGAIATQASGEPGYGPRALDLMRTGIAAPDTLQALLEADHGREVRQVAVVDAQGRVAVHTGSACIPYAGHDVGEQFSVQANMMLTDRVVPAMREAYVGSTEPLPERLLAALDAAEAEGGDIRGKQSAALLVVHGEPTTQPWNARLADLRVDDHPEPLRELRRLLVLRRAFNHMGAANTAAMRGDLADAAREMSEAERLAPDNLEIRYWHAVGLAANGRMEDAVPMFNSVFAVDPNWATLIERLPNANLLTEEMAAAILEATRKGASDAGE